MERSEKATSLHAMRLHEGSRHTMNGFQSFIASVEEIIHARAIASSSSNPPSAYYVLDMSPSPASLRFRIELDTPISSVIRVTEPSMISSSLRLAMTWHGSNDVTAMWTAAWRRVPRIDESGPAIVAWLNRFIHYRSPTYEVDRRIEEDGDEAPPNEGNVVATWQSDVMPGMLAHDDAEVIRFMQHEPIHPISASASDEGDETRIKHRGQREREALAMVHHMRERLSSWTFEPPSICYQLIRRQDSTPIEYSGVKVTTSVMGSWHDVAITIRCAAVLPFDQTAPRPMLWSVHGAGMRLVYRWDALLQWLGATSKRMEEASILVPTSMQGDMVSLDSVAHIAQCRWRDEAPSDQDVLDQLVRMHHRLVRAPA